jgi:hypothetical protein
MKDKETTLSIELKSWGAANKRMNIKASPHDELEKVLMEWNVFCKCTNQENNREEGYKK